MGAGSQTHKAQNAAPLDTVCDSLFRRHSLQESLIYSGHLLLSWQPTAMRGLTITELYIGERKLESNSTPLAYIPQNPARSGTNELGEVRSSTMIVKVKLSYNALGYAETAPKEAAGV